jgi:hypothetical protein
MVLLRDVGQVETRFVLLRDVDATDGTRFVLLPSVAPKMISEAMVRSAQTMHLTCIEVNTISIQTETIFTWSKPPRSTIWCAQSNFRAFGTFDANRAPILRLG